LSWPIRCENVFGERLWGGVPIAELRFYGDDFELSIGIYIYSTVKDITMIIIIIMTITIITIIAIITIATRNMIRIEHEYISLVL